MFCEDLDQKRQVVAMAPMCAISRCRAPPVHGRDLCHTHDVACRTCHRQQQLGFFLNDAGLCHDCQRGIMPALLELLRDFQCPHCGCRFVIQKDAKHVACWECDPRNYRLRSDAERKDPKKRWQTLQRRFHPHRVVNDDLRRSFGRILGSSIDDKNKAVLVPQDPGEAPMASWETVQLHMYELVTRAGSSVFMALEKPLYQLERLWLMTRHLCQ